MPFREDDVLRLARLAQIDLGPAEAEAAARDLDRLLGYIARLEAVDVAGTESGVHAGTRDTPLRADAPRPGLPREILTRGAPSAAYGLFEVPRVVSRGPKGPDAAGDEIAP